MRHCTAYRSCTHHSAVALCACICSFLPFPFVIQFLFSLKYLFNAFIVHTQTHVSRLCLSPALFAQKNGVWYGVCVRNAIILLLLSLESLLYLSVCVLYAFFQKFGILFFPMKFGKKIDTFACECVCVCGRSSMRVCVSRLLHINSKTGTANLGEQPCYKCNNCIYFDVG